MGRLTTSSVAIVVACMTVTAASGAEFHVSLDGNDRNPGSIEKPFRTIQKAADSMRPGDVCRVRPGTYRESVRVKWSGREGSPLEFVAENGGPVVLDGTDVISQKWSVHAGRIHKTRSRRRVSQLFLDGEMMVEARWPNLKFPENLWENDKWAVAGPGSEYGKVVDPELAATGIDWTGATAVLNVAHQFFTWTRTVGKHKAGSNSFSYTRTLGKSAAQYEGSWEDDRYYLTGKLEALDVPGEWFYDETSKMLYLWIPAGDSPANHVVEVKRRDYVFETCGADYVHIDGFEFRAAAFLFDRSDHCIIENCRVTYSSTEPHGREDDGSASPRINGDHNVVRRSSFAYGAQTGLTVSGRSNIVENCIIHDSCWNVSLEYVGLRMNDTGPAGDREGSIARRNTIYNTGGPCIKFNGYDTVIEYNHVYDGLRSRAGGSKDGSLVYTQRPSTAGSIVRYNWVHGAHPGTGSSPWGRGIGIRGDDRTRGLTIHHNVVWDCGGAGILVKGDDNRVHNNTVLDIGREEIPVGNYILLPTAPEKVDKVKRGEPAKLEVQNANSQAANNVARTITGSWRKKPYPDTPRIRHNWQEETVALIDTKNQDFRPKKNSPLIDAGRTIPPITDNYNGRYPDIGAYEHGNKQWTPGANWTEKK